MDKLSFLCLITAFLLRGKRYDQSLRTFYRISHIWYLTKNGCLKVQPASAVPHWRICWWQKSWSTAKPCNTVMTVHVSSSISVALSMDSIYSFERLRDGFPWIKRGWRGFLCAAGPSHILSICENMLKVMWLGMPTAVPFPFHPM